MTIELTFKWRGSQAHSRQLQLGIATTSGTRMVYTNRYQDGRDFGLNFLPGLAGLYVWYELL